MFSTNLTEFFSFFKSRKSLSTEFFFLFKVANFHKKSVKTKKELLFFIKLFLALSAKKKRIKK
jgi:hypothetical protein